MKYIYSWSERKREREREREREIGRKRLLSDKRGGRTHNRTEVERGHAWSDVIAYRHLKHDRRTIKTARQSGNFPFFCPIDFLRNEVRVPPLRSFVINSTKYNENGGRIKKKKNYDLFPCFRSRSEITPFWLFISVFVISFCCKNTITLQNIFHARVYSKMFAFPFAFTR